MSTSQVVEGLIMLQAKTIENFITKEEADEIIFLCSRIDPWENSGSSFWDNRILNASTIYELHNKVLGEWLYELRGRIGNAITEMYNLEEPIYPDLLQICRWFPGMEQQPHADDMSNVPEADPWFQHREYGSVIYLNTDYTGGHTYYPQHDFEIVPEVGKLAVHPADPSHLHGVTKMDGGMRYTIASFWSRNEKFLSPWKIEKSE